MQQYSEQDLTRVSDYIEEFKEMLNNGDNSPYAVPYMREVVDVLRELHLAYVTILQYQSRFQHIKNLVEEAE